MNIEAVIAAFEVKLRADIARAIAAQADDNSSVGDAYRHAAMIAQGTV